MQTPVGEHIRRLEERLKLLNLQVMQNSRSLSQRNQIEAEIRAVNLALEHYKAALELEKQLPPSVANVLSGNILKSHGDCLSCGTHRLAIHSKGQFLVNAALGSTLDLQIFRPTICRRQSPKMTGRARIRVPVAAHS